MSDATERPEDTIRRLAAECQELLAWKTRYAEAADLWDGLDLHPNDQVTAATLIAKISDFDTGFVNVATAASDGTDWVEQLGLFAAWKGMCIETRIERRDD